MNHTLKSLLAGLAMLPLLAQAQTVAGKVVMMTGQATALSPDGTVRTLGKEAPIYQGDLISSSIGSYVNLRFADGGYFLLRPETRFAIEGFSYTPPAAAPSTAAPAATPKTPAPLVTQNTAAGSGNQAFFRLLKGGFRSVSGLIGKINRDEYRVRTPVATIGIRGTAYSSRLCDGSCDDRAEIRTQLEETGRPINSKELVLVTTVDEGSISIQTASGTQIQNACEKKPSDTDQASECGAFFTTEDGTTSPVGKRPPTENSERSMDPAACS